jgi:hypothetical protein
VRARRAQWEDAPAVLDLLVARHTADIGLPLFRLEELDREVTPVDAPQDIRLRPLDPDGDAKVLHALDAEAFAASPDYVPESFDVFVQEHLRTHDVAPELSLVAQDGRRAQRYEPLHRRRAPLS